MAGLALVAVLVIVALKRSAQEPYVYTDLSVSEETDFADESFENGGKWYGLCQKDSIRSIEDFHKTVEGDRVLSAHFADFKWENAVLRRLEKPAFAYVYFRKNDAIVRKAKPIKLPAGDQYITDGAKRIRTHCCNDYEETPPPLVESLLEEPNDAVPPGASKIPLVAAGAPGASVAGTGFVPSGSFGLFAAFGGGGSGGGGGDGGCTGSGCNSQPVCTGPECYNDPVCTGPGCEPVCTGPDCEPYKTPEPGTGLTLVSIMVILAAAFFLRRFLPGRAGTHR